MTHCLISLFAHVCTTILGALKYMTNFSIVTPPMELRNCTQSIVHQNNTVSYKALS